MASPLLGYNTNVRHGGKLYHIQTEDSGIDRPHILTHLFADGGRVVASKKCTYADYVGREDYADHVKQMMREQHKAMFIGLRDGQFDEPGETTTAPKRPSNVDVDALERAAQRLSHPSEAGIPAVSELHTSDAPVMVSAPPDAILPDDLIPEPAFPEAAQLPSAPSAIPARPDQTTRHSTRPPTDTMRRPERPAHAEDAVRAGASIFGDSLLSEKSLDEVILSYLAEDLDEA